MGCVALPARRPWLAGERVPVESRQGVESRPRQKVPRRLGLVLSLNAAILLLRRYWPPQRRRCSVPAS